MVAVLLLAAAVVAVDPQGVLDAVDEARAAAGAAPLERIASIEAVARVRAERAAALPDGRRFSSGGDLDADLAERGISTHVRATDYTDVQRGYADPTGSILSRWRAYERAWRDALDPEWTAAGAATAAARDGSVVFVAVFVRGTVAPPDLRVLESRVVEAANALRRRRGLTPLVPSPSLAEVARAHSQAMAGDGAVSHVDREGLGPDGRARRAGITWLRIAENVASNRRAVDPVVTAMSGWESSPGHLANLLDDEVTHTGVGIALAGDGTFYFTQLFLRPRDRGGKP